MLLIQSDTAGPLSSPIHLPDTFRRDIKKACDSGISLMLLSKNGEARQYRIKSWKNLTPTQLELEVQDPGTISLSALEAGLLMGKQTSLFYSPEFMEQFSTWKKNAGLAPLDIEVRQDRQGLHIRVYDSLCLSCESLLLPAPLWASYSQEIEHNTGLIDQSLQQQNKSEINASIKDIAIIIDKILSRLEHTGFMEQHFRRIRIFQDVSVPYIPWEFVFKNQVLQFPVKVPFRKKESPPPGLLHFTSVYDPALLQSARESGKIIDAMEEYWEVESFSDAHYRDYKSHIAQSDILHFAGHGRTEFKKGQICLEGKWHQSLLFSADLRLACFNACHCGKQSAGIIQQTLEQGACSVLASPYAIPDRDWVDFSQFYRHFQAADPLHSISFYSLLDRRLQLFYRNYIPYQVKS